MSSVMVRRVSLPALFLLLSLPLAAQRPDSSRSDSLSRPVQALAPMVVTATRGQRPLLDVPGAASVITGVELQRRPMATVADLFVDLPGLDLTGVGPSQGRPVIRGFTGQRVLLLEDGLRVTNTRRQQDFGELPALVDQRALERVEVVRGAASVLYGSDAIGGVVNMVSAELPRDDAMHGELRFGYVGGTAGTTEPSGTLDGRTGRLAFRLDADRRVADAYEAPAGTFGNLTLHAPATVQGTGVTDRHLRGRVSLDLAPGQQLFASYDDYRAEDAGFGFLDPSLLGEGQPTIDIRYPDQQVRRGTVGYRGRDLRLPFADRIDVAAFRSVNRRHLDQDIFIPFGPDAGMSVATRNFTDVGATGVRVELARGLGARHLVTYGAEFNQDRASGTDSSQTTISGFGPPQTDVSNTPSLPEARTRSLGVFAQDEFRASERLSVIVGGRYQGNRAESFATAGLAQPPASNADDAGVWSASALYRLTGDVRLIASASRGFRSPNLVERFFDGVTPEGSGFQSRNPALRPESSLDVDLGFRLQRPRWSLETFVFQNRLHDGIRIAATGDTVMGFPEYQNINVDKLRVRGVEASASVSPFAGATLSGNYTTLDETDTDRPLVPVGDGYGSKLVLAARYRLPSGRAWAAVRFRHQGSRDAAASAESVVGPTIPGFATLDVDVGLIPVQLGGTVSVLTATVENVTNTLYAEEGNAGFVRPAPGRRVLLAWRTAF